MKSPDVISLKTDRYLELSVFPMTSLHAVLKLSDFLSNMLLPGGSSLAPLSCEQQDPAPRKQ